MTREDKEFEEIHRTFHRRINHYLVGMVGAAEAEDLTQEVFEKAHRALKNFRGESSLSTWVYKIATNCAIDRMRSLSWKRESLQESRETGCDPGAVSREEPSASEWTAEDHVIRKEMSACVREVIDGLSQNDRVVIILSDIEGFRDEEIAEILKVRLETAKIRLHRARSRLRKELEKNCSFSHDQHNIFVCEKRDPIEAPAEKDD